MALKITDIVSLIPLFSDSERDFKNFINFCDFAIGISSDSQIPYVIQFIQIRIGDYATLPNHLISWDLIKPYLVNIFGFNNKKEIEYSVLYFKQNTSENVLQYKKRADNLFEKINSFKLSDELAFNYYSKRLVDNFINGFLPQLRHYVIIEKPTTIEDAFAIALEEEMSQFNKSRQFDTFQSVFVNKNEESVKKKNNNNKICEINSNDELNVQIQHLNGKVDNLLKCRNFKNKIIKLKNIQIKSLASQINKLTANEIKCIIIDKEKINCNRIVKYQPEC